MAIGDNNLPIPGDQKYKWFLIVLYCLSSTDMWTSLTYLGSVYTLDNCAQSWQLVQRRSPYSSSTDESSAANGSTERRGR